MNKSSGIESKARDNVVFDAIDPGSILPFTELFNFFPFFK